MDRTAVSGSTARGRAQVRGDAVARGVVRVAAQDDTVGARVRAGHRGGTKQSRKVKLRDSFAVHFLIAADKD